MDQKGQASVDLLLATLIILILVSSIATVISKGMDSANGAEFSKAKVLADNVARSIDSVYSNGYGQYTIFESPTDFNYTVIVNSSGVNVIYNNKTSTSSIIPSNYLSQSDFVILPNETCNITNNNGMIQFTKIT